jgi:hypothetical protein
MQARVEASAFSEKTSNFEGQFLFEVVKSFGIGWKRGGNRAGSALELTTAEGFTGDSVGLLGIIEGIE